MNDRISVVVPVYNTPKKLFYKCICSLLEQTYDDVEIILVDDGSTSGIEMVCDKFAKHYSKIKVIHKKNGGLSSARNAGQRVATGSWILFVDSDDWIDKNTCSSLMKAIQNKDRTEIVVFGFIHHMGGKTNDYPFKYDEGFLINDQLELVNAALEFPSLFSSSCGKLFSLDFLTRNELWHDEVVRQGSEDLEFMVRVLIKAQNVYAYNSRFYHYMMNTASITNSFNLSNAYSVQKCLFRIEKTIRKLNREDLASSFYVRSWYALCASLISGFFNPNNGLRYSDKRALAKKYMSTQLAKRTIKFVDPNRLGYARKLVFLLAKNELYFPICLIAFIRGVQKKRI